MPQEFEDHLLSAYLDDELSAEERALVEQRLAVDASACELLEDLRRLRGLVSALPGWKGPDLQFDLPKKAGQPNGTAAYVSPADVSPADVSPADVIEQRSTVAVNPTPSVKRPEYGTRGPMRWAAILALAAGLVMLAVGWPYLNSNQAPRNETAWLSERAKEEARSSEKPGPSHGAASAPLDFSAPADWIDAPKGRSPELTTPEAAKPLEQKSRLGAARDKSRADQSEAVPASGMAGGAAPPTNSRDTSGAQPSPDAAQNLDPEAAAPEESAVFFAYSSAWSPSEVDAALKQLWNFIPPTAPVVGSGAAEAEQTQALSRQARQQTPQAESAAQQETAAQQATAPQEIAQQEIAQRPMRTAQRETEQLESGQLEGRQNRGLAYRSQDSTDQTNRRYENASRDLADGAPTAADAAEAVTVGLASLPSNESVVQWYNRLQQSNQTVKLNAIQVSPSQAGLEVAQANGAAGELSTLQKQVRDTSQVNRSQQQSAASGSSLALFVNAAEARNILSTIDAERKRTQQQGQAPQSARVATLDELAQQRLPTLRGGAEPSVQDRSGQPQSAATQLLGQPDVQQRSRSQPAAAAGVDGFSAAQAGDSAKKAPEKLDAASANQLPSASWTRSGALNESDLNADDAKVILILNQVPPPQN